MKTKHLLAASAMMVGGFASVYTQAMPLESNYYVRPGLRVGGGAFQDGLIENGPTTSSQQQGVVGFSSSEVSLENGTVKMYAEEFFNTTVGLQTFGGFGERLFIRNGAGTNWGTNLSIEGEVFGGLGPRAPSDDLPPTIIYDVGIVVHEAGVADWSNFLGIANDPCWGQDPLDCDPAPAPLANEFSQGRYEVPVDDWQEGVEDFYEFLFRQVSANILLDSNDEVLDLFVYSNLFLAFDTAGAGSGLENYVLDFENTAQYSQTFAPGVDVFSSSGEFLGLTTPPPIDPPDPVPAPGALQLALLGLASMVLGRRRRKA